MNQLARDWQLARAQALRLLARGGELKRLDGIEQKKDAHGDWMDECVPKLMGYGKDQLTAVAACLNMWREAWEISHPDGADDPGPSPKEADPDSPLAEAAKERMRALARKLFNEAEHPRDEHGRWTDSGGGGDEGDEPSVGNSASTAKAIGKDIDHQNLSSLKEGMDRGAFKLTVERVKDSHGQKITKVGIHSPVPANWVQHTNPTGSIRFYDPAKAGPDKDGYVGPKVDTELALPKTATPGVIYRGMSYEEYQNALKSGQFASRGQYNLGEAQVGLTFYSSDPDQAVSYAHGFAPWQYKAVPGRPAVLVGIADPGNHEVNAQQPTELGIRAPVPVSELREVYFGNPIITQAGFTEVIQESGRPPMTGSGMSPSASIEWQKEGVPNDNALAAPDRKHPGEGYSPEATIANGVIYTSNVYDAVRALSEDRPVELDQPRTAAVLIQKLGEVSKDMIAKGEKAPNFNLCRVTIRGTNLFCAGDIGISRVNMPQLDKEDDHAFFDHLVSKGYKVEAGEEYASYLRASQNELNGAKVARIAAGLRGSTAASSNPIFVSRDSYILDGHHRWAAEVGNDAIDNVLGNNKTMAIWRVDASITELLREAESFTGGEGKLSMADEPAPKTPRKSLREMWQESRDTALGLLRFFDEGKHPRDEHGRWTDGGGGDDEAGSGWTEQDDIDRDQENLNLVSKSPSQEKIDRWRESLDKRSEELAAQGLAGGHEDDQISQMHGALLNYMQEPDENLQKDIAGLNAVYDGNMRLKAAAFSYVRDKSKVAIIKNFGAVDHAAGVKALQQLTSKYAISTDQIEGDIWEDDAATRAIYADAGFKPRGDAEGGRVTMVKTELPGGGITKARAELTRLAEATAVKLDFDPKLIEYTDETREFELAGSKYKYAGSYTFGDSKIKLYTGQLNSDNVKGVTAHEIGHRKYDLLTKMHNIETEMMMRDPGPPPDPNHRYWWGKKGGTDAIMTPDGSMRPPYDEKYPLVHEWQQIQNMRPSLEQDDGITPYSKTYWTEWEKGKVNTNVAYHETMAEIARANAKMGKHSAETGKGWRRMYDLQEKVWAANPNLHSISLLPEKPQEKSVGPQHTVIDSRKAIINYLGEDFVPVEPEQASLIKIVFDDGEIIFVTPDAREEEARMAVANLKEMQELLRAKRRKSQFASAKRRSMALLEKYRDDQPRGETGPGTNSGSFASGGGGGGGSDEGSKGGGGGGGKPKFEKADGSPVTFERSSGPHAKDKTSASWLLQKETNVSVADVEAKAKSTEYAAAAEAKIAQMEGPDSKTRNKLPDGTYAPERAGVHAAMFNELWSREAIDAARPKPGERPTVYMIGGRGGSGKGWFTEKGGKGTLADKNALIANNDDVKAAHPEWEGWNAGDLHEEASDVGEDMEKFALENGLNLVIDMTMKSNSSVAKRFDLIKNKYKDKGYKISMHYMYASPAEAATRAQQRFVSGQKKDKKGRYVKAKYTLHESTTNEETFDAFRDKADYWEVYDNMVPFKAEPKLHSRKGG